MPQQSTCLQVTASATQTGMHISFFRCAGGSIWMHGTSRRPWIRIDQFSYRSHPANCSILHLPHLFPTIDFSPTFPVRARDVVRGQVKLCALSFMEDRLQNPRVLLCSKRFLPPHPVYIPSTSSTYLYMIQVGPQNAQGKQNLSERAPRSQGKSWHLDIQHFIRDEALAAKLVLWTVCRDLGSGSHSRIGQTLRFECVRIPNPESSKTTEAKFYFRPRRTCIGTVTLMHEFHAT